jgi:hypothetical protein
MSYPVVDEINNEYGQLTVIARAENRTSADGRARWVCACTCGGKQIYTGATLRKGKAVTCGCSRRDIKNKKRRKNDR